MTHLIPLARVESVQNFLRMFRAGVVSYQRRYHGGPRTRTCGCDPAHNDGDGEGIRSRG